MRTCLRSTCRVSIALAFGVALAPTASADDFYNGKSVTIVVGSAAGATYDFYARIIQRHLGRHIPGRPNVIVQNMPGAGGLIAANHVFQRAAQDGTIIGMFNRGAVISAILGSERARFDAVKYNWLGTTASFADNAHLFVIRAALPHRTVADLRNPALPVLNVGMSGSHHSELMVASFGFHMKPVRGYERAHLDLAFERGEVDGNTIAYTSIQSRNPEWLKNGFIRPLIQFARVSRHPDFPDIPTAREVAPRPEVGKMVELSEAAFLIAYPFALPPGVPADRVALMRNAFRAMLNDPDYAKDILTRGLEHSPQGGEEVAKIIEGLSHTPRGLMEEYKKIIAAAGLGD
jgi:tripartite-type tricarboxylate transporter receptor subunit TctC